MGETFGERIEEHNFAGGFQEDREHIEVYVGRLKGVSSPSSGEWRNEINWAEKLLIHVHDPAYNSRHNMELDEADPRVCNAKERRTGDASERCSLKSLVVGGQKIKRMRPIATRCMKRPISILLS